MTTSAGYPNGSHWTITRNDNGLAIDVSGQFSIKHAIELFEAIRYETDRALEIGEPRTPRGVAQPFNS